MDMTFLKFYSDTPKYTHVPGLYVMRRLMSRLGNPQDKLRCVHIAGTNGKGSCAAMLDAMLRAAGYRTGLYTSPDLTGPWERIRINGADITLDDFAAVTALVKTACQGLEEPSYFEKMTAAAFLYFAQRRCDYVVLEAGLGGRLDATNIISVPECAVITPIGLDHTAQLGHTLADIAREKAGIVKLCRPVICARQEPEAAAVIRERCAALSAPLQIVDITKIHPRGRSIFGQWFDYGEDRDITLSLLGRHQIGNACTAIEAGWTLGLEDAAIRAGLLNAVWPCRFEIIRRKGRLFVLDGAHNPHGAGALAAGLREYFPGQKFTVIMGVMADKDWRAMLDSVAPLAERFIFIDPETGRGLSPQVLTEAAAPIPAQAAGSIQAALSMIDLHPEPVCAFGSLHYIGYLRRLLTDRL